MPVTAAIRRRRRQDQLGLGMPGDNRHIIDVARSIRETVDAPVLGGIAVYLHGVGRSTVDLDLYAVDRRKTADQLQAAGAIWDRQNREHLLDGVPIHTVTPEEAMHLVRRTSVIDGVRVISLGDLVAIKLICGLKNLARSKDLGDVEDLVRTLPLDKRFAGRLPREIRESFKAIVDSVRAAQRDQGDRRF